MVKKTRRMSHGILRDGGVGEREPEYHGRIGRTDEIRTRRRD